MAVKGRVLVVDDAPGLRDRIVRWLEQNEYRYVFVESKEAAENLLTCRPFDAVIFGHEFQFRRSYPPRGKPHRDTS